jgi:hypothetical protein
MTFWKGSQRRLKSSVDLTSLGVRLLALASIGETITYGVLARDLGVRMADLTAALEVLMAEDAAAGRPFLAAVCEGRLSAGLPARGFYLAAQALGRFPPGTDPAAFAAAERAALRA